MQFVPYTLYMKRGPQWTCCRETGGLSASSRGMSVPNVTLTAKIHVQCGWKGICVLKYVTSTEAIFTKLTLAGRLLVKNYAPNFMKF